MDHKRHEFIAQMYKIGTDIELKIQQEEKVLLNVDQKCVVVEFDFLLE